MRPTIMRSLRPSLPICFSFICFLLVLSAACGGGDDKKAEIGKLSDPATVPTAPPWDKPPEVAILDPNALTTVGGAAPSPTPAPEGAPGVCGPKYTIESGDTFSSIAAKCGTTTQAMKDANQGVDPLTIKPGQVVNVPAATQPSP